MAARRLPRFAMFVIVMVFANVAVKTKTNTKLRLSLATERVPTKVMLTVKHLAIQATNESIKSILVDSPLRVCVMLPT